MATPAAGADLVTTVGAAGAPWVSNGVGEAAAARWETGYDKGVQGATTAATAVEGGAAASEAPRARSVPAGTNSGLSDVFPYLRETGLFVWPVSSLVVRGRLVV